MILPFLDIEIKSYDLSVINRKNDISDKIQTLSDDLTKFKVAVKD